MKATQGSTSDENSSRVRLRDLLTILIFCLILRGLGNWTVNVNAPFENFAFYGRMSVTSAMYGLLLVLCAWHLRLRRAQLVSMIGETTFRRCILAAIFGVVLFAFFSGENAIEAWGIAQFNEDLAYSLWSFPDGVEPSWEQVDLSFFIFMGVGVVLAPAVEEFFFRGLVLPNLENRIGLHKAAFGTSALFTCLHLQHPHIIGTLVFSLSISYLYFAYRSVALGTVVHSIFNLFALVSENFFFRDWQTRGREELRDSGSWPIEFAMFVVSVLMIAYAAYRFRLSRFKLSGEKTSTHGCRQAESAEERNWAIDGGKQ